LAQRVSYFEWMLQVLERAIKMDNLPYELYKVLRRPERVLTVSIPIRMDDGRLEVFEGYRVQYSSALGPYKGGIRFHPEVDLETDMALALGMTLKNALNNLPYGGGKGAVKVDPKRLSKGELERLSRGYARAIAPLIGDQVDIPAPDVGTTPEIMAWMVDEYSRIRGYNVPGVFTAKPPELWGNPVREYSTGYGVVVAARAAAERYMGGLQGLRVSVHGFGNVGQYSALFAQRQGAKVVAVSDTSGTVYDPNGIDVELAMNVKAQTGKVINYPKGEKMYDPMASLFVDAEVLMPSAIENVITKDNASKSGLSS
jgi:Glutamate dehydrogenase/leucine dehydrogenase